MTTANRRRFGGLVLTMALFPTGTWAQQAPDPRLPVATFAEIASRVGINSTATLIVTDSAGRQVKGRLTALSSDALSILSNGRTLTFSGQQVRELRQRVPDSIFEGALIGLAAGWFVPAFICSSGSDSSETIPCVVGSLILGGLPGFFIGMAVDAVQAKTVTVFRSPASTAVVVAPIVARRGLGVRASVRF